MMLTLMLTSKGVAAVPRASLVILSGTLTTFGLPLEGVAVILGVDAFLDMARTSINLTGNCLASAVMARWEGKFNPSKEKGFPVQSVQPQEPSPPSGANQDT
jgi:proton glutamate symport protein